MLRPPSLLPPAGSMSPSFLLLLLLLALPARGRREQVPGGAQRGRNAPASSSSSSSSPAAAGPSRFPRSRPDRRRGRLYCRVGIGFHLQLHPDGRVDGAHDASPLSEWGTGGLGGCCARVGVVGLSILILAVFPPPRGVTEPLAPVTLTWDELQPWQAQEGAFGVPGGGWGGEGGCVLRAPGELPVFLWTVPPGSLTGPRK